MTSSKTNTAAMPSIRRTLLTIVAGLLSTAMSAEAQVPSNALDYTRTQDFTYTAQGRVLTTTVEPTNAPTCSVTTYSYDA